ncbi:MAG: 2-oxo-hepta-3-ene-1,7-dioic acid hydratase, partial [Gammaproteobacteria bacterium]|nr:2-oxo-hepta-3-ene-1,7-dioic acid hydratase [Gammaproteobacteria bacterium]
MPILTDEQIQEAAERFDEAERKRRQMRPLTFDYPEMDMADAHAVQDAWVRMKVARGAQIRGRKVGLTSKAMQRVMNIGEPDYGTLLDDMFFGDGAEIEAAGFLDPRVEVEIAFVLSRPLAGENVTVEEVLAATEAVYPSLEL